jgi:hypothetical protein
MWLAGTPSDAMCYHKHTLPSLPNMLHVPFVIMHITPCSLLSQTYTVQSSLPDMLHMPSVIMHITPCNVLSQTYTAHSSQHATYAICRHTYHTMQCVITNIHCPFFPTCYVCRLSSYISCHFAVAIWPYYPRWLYSPRYYIMTLS